MPVESSPQYISDLNVSWPLDADPRFQGAQQIRTVKAVILKTFPSLTGAVSATQAQLNALAGFLSDSNALLAPAVTDWTTYQAVGAKDADARYVRMYENASGGQVDPIYLTIESDGSIGAFNGTDWFVAQPKGNYALSADLDTERERAEGVESTLSSSFSGAITTTNGKLASEVQRATTAEEALNSQIGSVSTNLGSETQRATAAETALSSRVDTLNSAFPLPAGWFIQAFTANAIASNGTITFPQAFSGTPVVLAQNGSGSDQNIHAYNPTNTNFQIWINNGGTSGLISVLAAGPR